MTNAKLKAVFGGLERAEAERMARELFTGQVHGDRVKHISVATKFRPVLDTFKVESESWSDTHGEAESVGETSSDSAGYADGESALYAVNEDNRYTGYDDEDIVSRNVSRTHSGSSSRSSSASRSSSRGSTTGGSRSVVPITVHEEFQEETGRQFYTLEEEWERRVAEVHGLPQREAFVKVQNGPAIRIRTADVPEIVDERGTERFKEQVLMRSPHVRTAADVRLEIEERRQSLRALVEKTEEAGRPFDVKSFRER